MFAHIWHGRLGGLRLVMVLAVVALVLIGLATISATDRTSEPPRNYASKQLVWIALSIVAFVAANMVHYHTLGRISYVLFVLALVLLLLVLIGKHYRMISIVPSIRGASRWINLIPGNSIIRLQPSELAKLVYILALAWYLRYRENYRNFIGLVGPFALTLLPMVLVLLEPDLGTVLLFLPVLFMVLFVAGARVRHLLAIVTCGFLISPMFYFIMEDYQLDRIRILLKQSTDDPYWLGGPGYQLHQSKICVATGQTTGQGWLLSPFVRYKPPPDRHNDFIFAIIAHQWGLLGAMLVLALYAIIIIGGLEIAAEQPEPFGRLLAVGICALIGAQMFINIGMTLGLMPITGMTLPFVSYGGSSLICNFLAMGLLFNVARHRGPAIAPKPFEFSDD